MNPSYEIVSIDQLNPYSGNPRHHSPSQIDQIAKSIDSMGFINPIIVDQDNEVICGHGRLLAARQLGLEHIPIIRIDHLDKAQKTAYRIADNKTAENAEWDNDLLKIELSYLLSIETEFEIDVTGFPTAEVDVIVSDLSPEEIDDPLPQVPAPDQVVSRIGDIFKCGKNRIGAGDVRDELFLDKLVAGNQVQMTCNDIPYNVPINGHVSGKGKARHDEFALASGEMTSEAYIQFQTECYLQLVRISADGSLHYVFIDWRHVQDLLTAGLSVFDAYLNLCVWAKTNGGMGSLYRSQHELCLIFKLGAAPHINNVELGKHGRSRSNVWHYAGMNSFGSERDELLAAHPTVKPIAMIADAIMDVTHHGDIVFDGFLGSGTMLIAAQRTHRICYATEIEPKYVDVALRRWMNETGEMPILESTGQTFEEVTVERVGSASWEDTDV